MRNFLLGLVFPALIASAAWARSSATDNTLSSRLDSVIDQAIAEKRIVGAVTIVAKNGKIVYHRAVGYADREAKTPMKEDCIFRLASMTKTLTTIAALALIQEGKLGLDDPLTKWLPDFHPKMADGSEPKITVRELLSHTAGFNYSFEEPEDGPYHRAKVSDGLDQPGLSLDENLKRIGSAPLLFEPGTKWHYSLATDILGAVVERAAASPLPVVVQKFVTGPLKMKDTAFVLDDSKRFTVPYMDGKPEPAKMASFQIVPLGAGGAVSFAPGRVLDTKSYPSGGAGMVGTANDYLKLLEAVRTGHGTMLNEHSLDEMTHSQTGSLEGGPGPGWGFTFGAAVLVDPTLAKSPHSAGTIQWGGIYGHHWFVDPKQQLTFVEMTNTAPGGMAEPFKAEIANAIYGAQNNSSDAAKVDAKDAAKEAAKEAAKDAAKEAAGDSAKAAGN
jgi:CubicO group peptidase (beta-lactamase class C family)